MNKPLKFDIRLCHCVLAPLNFALKHCFKRGGRTQNYNTHTHTHSVVFDNIEYLFRFTIIWFHCENHLSLENSSDYYT